MFRCIIISGLFINIVCGEFVENKIYFDVLIPPEVNPNHTDQYISSYLNIEKYGTRYVTGFKPLIPRHHNVHHMLLHTCDEMDGDELSWDPITDEGRTCNNMRIIFAWARNAPGFSLPVDVAFRLGQKSNIKNFVLEVHFATKGNVHPVGIRVETTKTEPKYLAGMMLMAKDNLEIPPHAEKITGDISCPLPTPEPIVPFAYRVHTHKLGLVVSGYKVENGPKLKFTLIGKRSPQWPQSFNLIKDPLHVKTRPYDALAARCTYSSPRNVTTTLGSNGRDEMCNFYIMFYTESRKTQDHFLVCGRHELQELSNDFPKDSDIPLERNLTLEKMAEIEIDDEGSAMYSLIISGVSLLLILFLAVLWIMEAKCVVLKRMHPRLEGFKEVATEDN